MEIYRPGRGKFSSQTLKSGEGESKNSGSNSPEVPETERHPETEPAQNTETERTKRPGNERGQKVNIFV
jgi:hypothetical protein